MFVYKNPEKGVYACPVTRQGKVTLADDIWDVYDCAFEKCDKITEVQLPASVRWAGAAAFSYMFSCKKITVDEKSKYLKSVEGVLFTKDGQVLIAYPAGKKDSVYQVPKGVRVIADGAFMGSRTFKTGQSHNRYVLCRGKGLCGLQKSEICPVQRFHPVHYEVSL